MVFGLLVPRNVGIHIYCLIILKWADVKCMFKRLSGAVKEISLHGQHYEQSWLP